MLYVINNYPDGKLLVYDDKDSDFLEVVSKEDVLALSKIIKIQGVKDGKIVDWVQNLEAKKKLLGSDNLTTRFYNILKSSAIKDGYLHTSMYIAPFIISSLIKYNLECDCKLNYLRFNEVSNLQYIFDGVKINEMILDSFNTKGCLDMSYMFRNVKTDKFSVGSYFDTSEVITMESMFMGFYTTSDVYLSGFSSKKLRDATFMFADCIIPNLRFGKEFKLDNTSLIRSMFARCKIGKLEFDNIELHGKVFANNIFEASDITLLDLSKLNVDNLEFIDMSGAFGGTGVLVGKNKARIEKIIINRKAYEILKDMLSSQIEGFNLGISEDLLRHKIEVV